MAILTLVEAKQKYEFVRTPTKPPRRRDINVFWGFTGDKAYRADGSGPEPLLQTTALGFGDPYPLVCVVHFEDEKVAAADRCWQLVMPPWPTLGDSLPAPTGSDATQVTFRPPLVIVVQEDDQPSWALEAFCQDKGFTLAVCIIRGPEMREGVVRTLRQLATQTAESQEEVV